ncbi:MAG: DNA mismatch repair endonuclease MutL [Bacteroidetes bacterium]|nr:DNA mismatch repair endonuclease MutL [Bacteroidota bacterium]
MTDIIKLLPDSVANQIAAGEVIQRPASAVKELMENALDAGATDIQLIIKDAGKSLIQVTDNGSGMNETDARMSFERHATSKILKAEDLFEITTMGFRGEAMASIAAIAQVELKTRLHDAETGTLITVEGSKVINQEPCACQPGTSVIVKNLFFNIPARRNFLKSNASETRHIVEEFQRISIARPDTKFSLFHDGIEVFRLYQGNLKQRIMGIYGNNYNERLVPVEEETTIIKLGGFVLKPEFARKTRGEQYFFVNNRFIKNGYLHHAVTDAFEDLLPHGSFPSYFLMIDIDPAKIDINIHPTKTEIKFEDERSVYAIIRASVKRALGKFSVTPSLDFEQENAFNIPVSMYQTLPKSPEIRVDPSFNPFKEKSSGFQQQGSTSGWEKLYEAARNRDEQLSTIPLIHELPVNDTIVVYGQYEKKYILALNKGTLILIDQQAAHERILYEYNQEMLEKSPVISQQELFPQTLQFAHDDFVVLAEISEDIRKLGFDLREFGKNTFVLNAVPSGIPSGNEREFLERILESYKNSNTTIKSNHRENLLRSISFNLSVKSGVELDPRELNKLANDLFNCSQPNFTPSGKPTFVAFPVFEIEKKFQQRNG